MLGRDHHDTGGTDSPFRETANIHDGSNIMAEMAVHCFAGNAARGMSLVALHNGGGVGIGKAINGGFGLVLDGSERVDRIIARAIPWDVMVGVARRAWAGNAAAVRTCRKRRGKGTGAEQVTLPFSCPEERIGAAIAEAEAAGKGEQG
jgi:urocanate hydratase